MTRLIDADALKKDNERLLRCDFPYLSEMTLEELIDEAPTIDAEPVRHGKWREYPISDGMNQCSKCGVLRFGKSNYCPNCGCRMDEE